jgi:hypothetical protein
MRGALYDLLAPRHRLSRRREGASPHHILLLSAGRRGVVSVGLEPAPVVLRAVCTTAVLAATQGHYNI